MSASVLPALVSGFAGLPSAEEPTRALPMPAIAFGVIAFCCFLLGLGVLWTFRNTGAKVPPSEGRTDEEFHG